MCEYCGCQSLAAIAELTREHDEIVDLIGETRAANRDGDVAAVRELCGRIAARLEPHTLVEELGLFPAMAADFPEQIAALHDEHRLIDAGLTYLAHDATPTDAGRSQQLRDVLVLLREHILKEQDGVFPAALSTLTTAEWEHLDQIRDAENAKQVLTRK